MTMTAVKSALRAQIPGAHKLARIDCAYDSGVLNWTDSLYQVATVYTFSADEKLYLPTEKKWTAVATSGGLVIARAQMQIDWAANVASPLQYDYQGITAGMVHRHMVNFRLRRSTNDITPLLFFAPGIDGVTHYIKDSNASPSFPIATAGTLKTRALMNGSFYNETDDGSPADDLIVEIDIRRYDSSVTTTGTFRLQVPWFEIWLLEALAWY